MKTVSIGLMMAIAIAGGLLAGRYLASSSGQPHADTSRKPLYWVAPMDPDYRRDGPGKSPMGMDLVPVYDETPAAGTVSVSPAVMQSLGIRTATVAYGRLQQQLDTIATVQWDASQLQDIHPRVAGWLEKLHVHASGDAVASGQPLYTLYSPQLVSAQEEYLLALRQGDRPLIDAASARLQALQLSDELIRRLAERRRPYREVTFYAPHAGTIAELAVREGAYVQPASRLMRIAATDSLWLEAELFESQAGWLSTPMQADIRSAFLPGLQQQASIDHIYPALDAGKRSLRLRMTLNPADPRLRPGMLVHVRIPLGADRDTALVPVDALIRTGTETRVVKALGDGQFRSVPVHPGLIGEQQAQILHGLSAGDQVVISAQFLLDAEASRHSGLQRFDNSPSGNGAHQHD